MSLLTELQRIRNSKDAIKAAIEQKGVEVPDYATLDDYSQYIDVI